MCSPRKGGNTEILVQEVMSGAKDAGSEVEMLRVSEMTIAPCDDCEACHESGECCIDDDMQIVYKKLLSADGIVIGSPVYFWSMSAQAKIIMDRTYALAHLRKRLKNKVGAAVVATNYRGCSLVLSLINTFFLQHHMYVAGLGASGVGGEGIGGVRKNTYLNAARELGFRVVECIHNTTRRTESTD